MQKREVNDLLQKLSSHLQKTRTKNPGTAYSLWKNKKLSPNFSEIPMKSMLIWNQLLGKDRQSRCRNISKRLKIGRNCWFQFFLTWMSRCYQIMWKRTQLCKISGKMRTLITKWTTCLLVNPPWSPNSRSLTSRGSWASFRTQFYALSRTSRPFWRSKSWLRNLFWFCREFHQVVSSSLTNRLSPLISMAIGGFT